MTIVLVGQGSLPIPPRGWGAVEHIIWQYAQRLREQGHRVHIVNQKWRMASLCVAWLVWTRKVEVVHVHQERALRWIVPLVGKRSIVVVTSHTPIDLEIETDWARAALEDLCLADNHLPLNPAVAELIRRRRPTARVGVLRNGVDVSAQNWQEHGNGRAICLGKLQARKRQRDLAEILARAGVPIDFVGPLGDEDLAPERQHMKLGEWDRETINRRLTEYSALVLVSHAEGQPLVVSEALAAGLSVVVSAGAAQNLDLSQPFLFLAEGPGDWARLACEAIRTNPRDRRAARSYADASFSVESVVAEYACTLQTWIDGDK